MNSRRAPLKGVPLGNLHAPDAPLRVQAFLPARYQWDHHTPHNPAPRAESRFPARNTPLASQPPRIPLPAPLSLLTAIANSGDRLQELSSWSDQGVTKSLGGVAA